MSEKSEPWKIKRIEKIRRANKLHVDKQKPKKDEADLFLNGFFDNFMISTMSH